MLGINEIVGLLTIAGVALAIISYLARLWYNMKNLVKRVGDLEKNEQQILSGYLTSAAHQEQQRVCQREIYRDISALEGQIATINTRLDRSEEMREKCRLEDLKWKAEMSETMVEIRTIVKGRWKSDDRQ